MSKPILTVQTISVYISTTLVLLLLGIVGTLFVAGQEISEDIQNNLGISVIMSNNADEAKILKVKKSLEKKNYVQTIEYISREQALEEQKKELGIDPLEQLGYNPYEAELEITIWPEYANRDSLATIEKGLLRNKSVKEVLYQKELMDSVNDSIRKAGATAIVFLVLLTIISWSLISNMVRISIYSKRFLLHTMKLTGATWGFIRKPFITSNLWIGLLSGIMANLLLVSGLLLLKGFIPGMMSYLPFGSMAIVGITVILFGLIICSLCAYLSVNSFLRMRSNDLYFI